MCDAKNRYPAGHYLFQFKAALVVGCIAVNLGMIAGVNSHQSNTRRLQRRTIRRADHSSTYAAITFRFWFLGLVWTLSLGLAE